MLSTEELLNTICKYVDCAFKHEEEFLKRFWIIVDGDMLVDLYMGDVKITFTILNYEGGHISASADVVEFIEWCNETMTAVELTKEQDDALWKALQKSTTLIAAGRLSQIP